MSATTYFAEVLNNIVVRVIVAERKFINSGLVGDPANWIETAIDGSVGKNYAGVGYEYHTDIGAFVAPKPFASWSRDAQAGKYVPPKPEPAYPANVAAKDVYQWDEKKLDWIKPQ